MMKKINDILSHIRHVQENCRIIGAKLLENGDETGRVLIANSMLHDNSKFHGIEWEYLHGEPSQGMEMAVYQHNRTNPHHPEFWGKIQNMPTVYIAEMTADWKARSSEFGTDLVEWVSTKATKRYKFKMKDRVGREISRYIEMLVAKPFESTSSELPEKLGRDIKRVKKHKNSA